MPFVLPTVVSAVTGDDPKVHIGVANRSRYLRAACHDQTGRIRWAAPTEALVTCIHCMKRRAGGAIPKTGAVRVPAHVALVALSIFRDAQPGGADGAKVFTYGVSWTSAQLTATGVTAADDPHHPAAWLSDELDEAFRQLRSAADVAAFAELVKEVVAKMVSPILVAPNPA